ncbi:MAG: hypothetical protein QW739_01675 [Candidatus Odinarchaeota archaeon]
MSIIQLVFYILAAGLTITGITVKDNMKSVKILAAQALTVILVNLVYYLQQIILGAYQLSIYDLEALVIEILVTIIVVPLIIRIVKASFLISKALKTASPSYIPPIIEFKKTLPAILGFNTVFLCFSIYMFYTSILPAELLMLPLSILIFINSVIGMILNRDAVKIIVALNMAINAFTPLLSSLPLPYIILELTSLILVNIIAVFIIVEMLKKYKTINVSEWSVNYD